MTNRRKHLEEALRTCAEAGVQDSGDPWPAIRERASERIRGRAVAEPRRLPSLPRTRLGWAFATLVTLLVLSTGAYATGGIVDILNGIFEKTVPYLQEHELGTPMNEKQTKGGVTVTIKRVYADSYYVVVGYDVEGLDKLGERPNDLDTDLVAEMRLSDPGEKAGDKKFAIVDSFQRSWAEGALQPAPSPGSEVGTFVFESPERLEAGEEHRFRARVDIFRPMESTEESVADPFFFDLRVPVREAPVIEVNQTEEASGVPITLKRVVNSPVRTNAYLCFDPPEGRYDLPMVKTRPFEAARSASNSVYYSRYALPGAVEEGCATYHYPETLYDKPGVHYLTVTELRPSSPNVRGAVKGPWRFSFEVPRP